jgi:hypothetical protein
MHERNQSSTTIQQAKADMMMVGQSTLRDSDASLLHIQYRRAEPQVSVPLPLDWPFWKEGSNQRKK